jgi:hypothetical protein
MSLVCFLEYPPGYVIVIDANRGSNINIGEVTRRCKKDQYALRFWYMQSC